MFVIDGLSKCAGILGIDFIRESQFCISADHVLYCIVFQEVAHMYIVQSQGERALLGSAP